MTKPFESILDYWFGPLDENGHHTENKSPLWWGKNPETDADIQKNFEPLLLQAKNQELQSWLEDPHGIVATIILLDQFSRNIYRDTPNAFAQDPQALQLATNLVESKTDENLPYIYRLFSYLPFEHSEDSQMQERSIELFEKLAAEVPESIKGTYQGFLDFAYKHKVIIDRFGRYPHRNEILGRESTPEEISFLKEPGSSF